MFGALGVAVNIESRQDLEVKRATSRLALSLPHVTATSAFPASASYLAIATTFGALS